MNEINFLPQSYLRQRARRRRSLLQSAAMALAVLTGLAFWGQQVKQTGDLRAGVEAIEAEARAVKREQTESARLIGEYKALLHQTRVQRELAQPVTQTQVLAVLGQVLPRGVSLARVDLSAVRPTPAAIDAATKPKAKSKKSKGARDEPRQPQYLNVTVEGLAPDDLTVANVIGLLSEHGLFSEVRLKHSRGVVARGVALRGFEMTMRVDLERDIQPRGKGVAYAD